MKKNTIIFDLDGTLLDTLDDLRNSVNHALSTYRYPQRTRQEIRSFVGNGVRNLMCRALPDGDTNPDFEKVFQAFREHYALHCNDMTKPYDGIMELLEHLHGQNYKMAIVSNKSDAAVKNLNMIYFSDYIDIAIGENEAQGVRKKPAPDTVFESLKALDCSVEEAYYVGDSEVDIATSANAGMDAIICTWGFRDEALLVEKGAKNMVHNPAEILKLLERI